MVISNDDIYKNKLFQLFLDKSNDGVNVVDTQGNIVYANKISANYANTTIEKMKGKHISNFYPHAALLKVLENKSEVLDKKINVVNKKYVVSSYPLYIDHEFVGAFAIFNDIKEIDNLNRKIKYLELDLTLNKSKENISYVIGNNGSLKNVLTQAKRTVGALGGPRHSIITGQSGTGKTMLANLIYIYAKEVGVVDQNAPFIEVNCSQFTNVDLAAVEIFGSEKGAFTGSTQRKGLFEQANSGILFLDEAHALGHYQTLLFKAIESGKIRRIGGTKEISVDVIIIAASTRNLKKELLPELYQRLAQYELHLPLLSERSLEEKELLLDHFIVKYENAVADLQAIKYHVKFSDAAKTALLSAVYPRNIRQFRDIINCSIDAASPLILDIEDKNEITATVLTEHLPIEIFHGNIIIDQTKRNDDKIKGTFEILINSLHAQGLGPRKISNILKNKGYTIQYYQVAYYLKKRRKL
jgi:arginine utilization regulatory protein